MNRAMSKVLVTGVAGFIGMRLARQLLARGDRVLCIDNLNDYYDPALKQARLAERAGHPGFNFERVDITDAAAVMQLFVQNSFDRVVHLAAQAGVRHMITHPGDHVQANLVGFINVLEGCLARRIGHLVNASSSSVYGGNRKLPFAEDDPVDHPVSLYGLPCSGLRFFTVYGPWGRPDMTYFSFTQALLAGEPIKVFNHGQMSRDFNDIDIVACALGTAQSTADAARRRAGQPRPCARASNALCSGTATISTGTPSRRRLRPELNPATAPVWSS